MANNKQNNLTYADKVINIMKEYDRDLEIDEIIKYMNIDISKQTYVIDAIKKIENPFEKRLYLGHKYVYLS
jgi:hypothetical protein